MISPTYLPPGSALDAEEVSVCGGVVAVATQTYSVASDRSQGRRGGHFTIVRWLGQPFARLDIPAERWSAATIAGQPAAVAQPIIPLGLGQSAVVLFSNGIMTQVQAIDLPFEELQRIVEGLY
jgi:hypothetical protein